MNADQPLELAGDDFAAQFGALFDQLAPALHRYLTARVGPTVADDLLSETFVSAIADRAVDDVSPSGSGLLLAPPRPSGCRRRQQTPRRRWRALPPDDC